MLSANKDKFSHRIQTIVGQLRNVLRKAGDSPADAYGQLHVVERSIQQAKMFIVKDLIDQLYSAKNKDLRKKTAGDLYDCLGFHRDELPTKNPD